MIAVDVCNTNIYCYPVNTNFVLTGYILSFSSSLYGGQTNGTSIRTYYYFSLSSIPQGL